jgi:hypothetical protein
MALTPQQTSLYTHFAQYEQYYIRNENMETKVTLKIYFLLRDALRTDADQSGTYICVSKLRGQRL